MRYDDDEASAPPLTPAQKVERAALALVLRAEQNTSLLRRKLSRKGFDAALIEETIDRLVAQNLVNDERYAAAYARSRARGKAEGPRALRFAVQKRGIERRLAAESVAAVLDTETECALLRRFLEKKLKIRGAIDSLTRRRLRFEGFSADAIEIVGEELVTECSVVL